MKILVHDLESHEDDIYDLISKTFNIDFVKTKKENIFFKEYENYSIDDIIIIDVTLNIGEKIFNYITLKNPKQKIIVTSNTLTYNHTFTCEDCSNEFNRRLILKPIDPRILIYYIQNFNALLCKFSSNSNEIIEIMEDILKQFSDYKYCSKTKYIQKNNNSKSNIKELVNITELLKTHNIPYSIDNENIKLYF